MQVSTILDIAIIAIPTCYAALVAVQFASGLARLGKRPVAPVTTPIAPVEPQGATVEVEQIPDAIESEGYCPNVVAPIAVSIASIAPESTAISHIAEADEVVDPWLLPCEADEVTAGDAPAGEVVKPIALLPAFIANTQEPEYADADHRLVESYYNVVEAYWQAVPTHNIIPFVRPVKTTQKPQQQHPALEGMTLRAMRQLGAELRIKGARRWNTQQARAALAAHYGKAA